MAASAILLAVARPAPAFTRANADTAWQVRRTSDNLSWDQWLHPTPDGVLHSWDCINSVVALQVTPPDGTAPKP